MVKEEEIEDGSGSGETLETKRIEELKDLDVKP